MKPLMAAEADVSSAEWIFDFIWLYLVAGVYWQMKWIDLMIFRDCRKQMEHKISLFSGILLLMLFLRKGRIGQMIKTVMD